MTKSFVRAAAALIVALVMTVGASDGVAIECAGDCDGDGILDVAEIVTAVSIALGEASTAFCLAADHDADGRVTVDEILRGVIGALHGCDSEPSPSPEDTTTPTLAPSTSTTPAPSETPMPPVVSPSTSPTATRTPTSIMPNPTSTIVDCGARAPVVSPLPAPVTDQPTVTLTGTVYVHGPYSRLRVCGADCSEQALGSQHPAVQQFSITAALRPNDTTELELCTLNPICGDIACAEPIAVTHRSEAPATPTASPSPTPTSCGAVAPSVDPVISPTTLLEQAITGSGHVTGARYLLVTSEAGQFSGTGYHGNFPVTVRLLPNQANHLTVCIYNQLCGETACSSTDNNGAPLTIVQQE